MKKPTGLRAQASIIAVSILSAAGLAGAGEAKAGTYPMYACDVPGVYLASPTKAAWKYYDNAGQVATTTRASPSPTAAAPTRSRSTTRPGSSSRTQASAWSSRSRRRVRSRRSRSTRVVDWTETQLTAMGPGQAPAWGLNLGATVGTAPGGSSSGFDGTGTTGAGHDSGPLPAGTRTRRLGVLCSYMGGGYGNCTLPSPFLRIRGLKTTLREDAQPTAAIDGGTLASAGSHSGTETVTYSAADAESGVERVEVLLDGVVVAKASDARDLSRQVIQQTGDCEYIGLRACPATASGTLSVNTAGVPDGAYGLEVRATDAAGNSRFRPPTGSRSSSTTCPTPSSCRPRRRRARSAARRGSRRRPRHRRRRRRTTGSAPPRTRRCARRSPRAAAASSRAGTARRCSSPASSKRPDGTPIAGAKLHVLHQDKTFGAAMVPAGEITTDCHGHVPPRHDGGPVAHDPHRLPRPSRGHGVRGDDRHRARRDRAGGADDGPRRRCATARP